MPSSSDPTAVDGLLARHRAAPARSLGDDPRPRLGVVVVTCMDCRIDPLAVLGLERGEAHILRNAGGLVTEDVVRSIAVSQAALGTREVIVMQHTRCGMAGVDEATLRQLVADASGVHPEILLLPFDDVETSVRRGLAALRSSAILAHRDRVRGFVLDVESGRLTEIELP